MPEIELLLLYIVLSINMTLFIILIFLIFLSRALIN